MRVTFHPEAARRFDELANQLRGYICEVDEPASRPQKDYHLYPAAKIGPQDIKDIRFFFNSVKDDRGNVIGRIWREKDRSFGMLGEGCRQLVDLSVSLAKTPDLQGRVGTDFLVDNILTWLKESPPGDSLTKHLAASCQDVVKEHHIWIPLFRVYCASQFQIGPVTFRPISEQVMNAFFDPPGRPPVTETERQHLDKRRSRLQGTLAACVKVTAETKIARQIARSIADESIALLRFLSPTNLQPGIRSYCLPLGSEGVEIETDLIILNEDRIQTIQPRVS